MEIKGVYIGISSTKKEIVFEDFQKYKKGSINLLNNKKVNS